MRGDYNRLTTEVFIERSRLKHNSFYTYPRAKYVNQKTKVIITCPIHGDFEQLPSGHLGGKGCPKCSGRFMNTEIFKEKGNRKHDSFYGYTKTVYVKSSQKVIITCPIHGDFEQTPASHLSGAGCAKCSFERNSSKLRKTTESFIKEAREVHGSFFGYTKTVYGKSNRDNVIITCPIHGDFETLPYDHLKSKTGCPKCSGRNKTTEDIIKEANKVHDNFYGYDKTVYVNSGTKIIITCPIHGDFSTLPATHIQRKCGCPKCAKRYMDQEYYIECVNKVHNNFYGYTKTVYVSAKKKVIITCPIHGDFEQIAHQHMKGCGCPKCSVQKISDKMVKPQAKYIEQNANSHLQGTGCPQCYGRNLPLDNEEFIRRSKIAHDSFYTYPRAKYVNTSSKVIITCPIHGDFEQNAASHMQGTGCAKCYGIGFDYLSYEEAKKIIQPLGLKSMREYFEWYRKNKEYCQEIGLPGNPPQYYSKNK